MSGKQTASDRYGKTCHKVFYIAFPEFCENKSNQIVRNECRCI